MGIFDRFRKWKDGRRTKKIMKKGTQIEKLTNLRMDALKKRGEARKAGKPDEAMKWQKLAQGYELEMAKLG